MYSTKQFNPKSIGASEKLRISTVRSYDGGLNVADTDLNLSPTYAKVLDNMERGTDGTLSLRPGTTLLARVGSGGATIINCIYFNGYVITVMSDGSFYEVDGAGGVTQMYMVTGGGNPFTPSVTFASFTIFNSDLLISNGKDKPIIIPGRSTDPNYMRPDYLIDKGSGSNVNTPIGSFIIAHGQFTCIAGIPSAPSMLYISAQGTSGTWLGDSAPNDAIAIDLGPRVSLGSATITGMVAYRDKLLVTFERGVLPMTLGVFTGTPPVHAPTDDGFIEEFGCMSHRSLISVGDDTFYNDNIGINAISRIVLFSTLRPVRVSQLVDPLITGLMTSLTQAQISRYVFAVYDLRHFRYMIFIPVFATDGVTITETIGFSYTDIPALKVTAWSRLRGWTWQCACRTGLQNVIFGTGNKLYYYAFDDDASNVDFKGDSDYGTTAGVPINFEWEMPWADFKARMDTKIMRYIGLDTKGTGNFTCELYVDNIIYSGNDRAPILSIDFLGGDSVGYGAQLYGDSPYGGGRNTSDERLYAFTAKFKISKLRFFGSTTMPLRFVSISIAYLRGTFRR